MEGEKDDGKQVVPLFPGLRINDGDKGGPRGPPRNKMALFDEHNVPSESSRIESNSRSRSMVAVPPGIVCSTFASKSNVARAKRKPCPILANMNECPHSAEWYHRHCSQNPSSSANPMMKAKCDNDFSSPPFLHCHDKFHRHNKERIAALCSNSSGKLHGACLNLSNETKNDDRMMGNHAHLGEENSKLSQSNGLIRKCPDDVASKSGLAVKKEEASDIFVEGSIPSLNITTDEVVRVIGQRLFLKARKIMVHQQKVFSLQMFELHRLITVQRLIGRTPETLCGNNFPPNKPSIKFPPMNKLLYISPLDTSPSIAKTKADALNSDPVTECGTEAVRELLPLPKPNVENGHLAQPLAPKTLGPLGPLTNPASIPFDPKLAPWCLPPQSGNQWLIPVRSPSEGLIYKPYPGPCFPTVGFLGPVYGNSGQAGLSSLGGMTYGVPGLPAPNEHGSGGFCGPELSHSYFQPFPMPSINATESDHETKPMIEALDCGGNLHASEGRNGPRSPEASPPGRLEREASPPGRLEREASPPGRLEREASPPGRLERDALSLFPTTPSFLKDQRDKQRVEVIKVVPHNRNSAPASAARIFQSIQEERRNLD